MKFLSIFLIGVLAISLVGLFNFNYAFADSYTIDIKRGSSVPGCEKSNSCYNVHNFSIEAGDAVTWRNMDSAAHTITGGTPSKGPDGRFDSSMIGPGETFTLTFTYADRFPFFCLVHPWVIGSVNVVEQLKTSTILTLQVLPKYAGVGEYVTISGKLTSNGKGISGATIQIFDFDPIDIPDPLGTIKTDSNGNFKARWQVRDVDTGDRKLSSLLVDLLGAAGSATAANNLFNMLESTTVEIYAQYNGNSNYNSSTSCKNNCRNNIITITGTSTEEKILGMVLGSVIPGGDSTLDTLQLVNSILNSKELSQSEYNIIESKLQSAFMSELGIDANDLSLSQMVSMLENPYELEQYKQNSNKASQSYSNFQSQSSSRFDKINEQLRLHDEKRDDLREKIQHAKSLTNNFEKIYGSKLSSTHRSLNEISSDIENEYLFESAQMLIERGYTSQAYKDIANENYRLDQLMRKVDSLESQLKTNYSDSDRDGIVNIHDKCKNQKETYNGYQDWDGCPDTKPFDFKKNSIKLQSDVNSNINALKPGVHEAERSLYSTWYNNAKAQKEVDKAWTALWWAKKYLGDSEWTQKEGEQLVSKSKFKDAYYKYKYSWDRVSKIEQKLFEITKLLNNAHKIQ